MRSEQPSATADEASRMPGRRTRADWEAYLFLAVAFLTLFARFRSPSLLLGSYQDDFFYYLKVAQNIAITGVSTFNGINSTNGYHPLWMGVLVVLCQLFHGTAFFLVLQTVSLAAAALTYLLMLRVMRLYLADVPARVGAFALGLEALLLIRYGMEITLTLPLAMLLLWLLLHQRAPKTFGTAAVLGVVASLVILSRLDSALLVALLCVALLLPPLGSARNGVALLGFICGVLPLLALYFAGNLHFFHLLTPVSGLAKQMKPTHMPSAATWQSLMPTDRMRRIVLLPELILLALGAIALLASLRIRPVAPEALFRHRVLAALLLFPLLHFFTLSVLSDWTTWPWYFYSITLAGVGAYILLVQRWPKGVVPSLAAIYTLVLLGYTAAYAARGPNSLAILASSQQVAAYMDAHPGVYMMGDQAGTTAYLSHQPIIQTEGLVMDRRFLLLMRAGTPLRQVAAAYHANYYAVIGSQYDGACLHLREPSNAGPDSPRMRGSICHQPLTTFYREVDHQPIRIFDAAWIQ